MVGTVATMPIRVVVLGSCLLYREGARACLEGIADVRVDAIAGMGADAIEQTTELAPGVVLVEGCLPGRDGVETVRAVREALPAAGVIALVGDDEVRRVREIWDLGVRGLVPKSASPGRLVDAVRAVAAGRRVVVDGILWWDRRPSRSPRPHYPARRDRASREVAWATNAAT